MENIEKICTCYLAFIPIKKFTDPLIKVTAVAKGVEITWWVMNLALLLPQRKVCPYNKSIHGENTAPSGHWQEPLIFIHTFFIS